MNERIPGLWSENWSLENRLKITIVRNELSFLKVISASNNINITFSELPYCTTVMLHGFLQVINNPILKDLLLYSPTSTTACFFLYCLTSPLLEEVVYRGFLLKSLASKTKWWQAVIISSCIFSAAHFSVENSPQLFIIGCVLGSAYCWTGSLAAPFTIHSMYNAITLLVTVMSQT